MAWEGGHSPKQRGPAPGARPLARSEKLQRIAAKALELRYQKAESEWSEDEADLVELIYRLWFGGARR